MATPTALIRLRKQVTGENNNEWGELLNDTLDRIDEAIAGVTTVATTGGNYILTVNDYDADEARQPVLKVTGTLVMDATIVIPQGTRRLLVSNETSGAFDVTISTGSGTDIVVAQGSRQELLVNVANVEAAGPAVTSAGDQAGTRW